MFLLLPLIPDQAEIGVPTQTIIRFEYRSSTTVTQRLTVVYNKLATASGFITMYDIAYSMVTAGLELVCGP